MKRLPTVRVRRAKAVEGHKDFWVVTQSGKVMTKHGSKKAAEKAAAARRHVLKKRRARVLKSKKRK